MSEYAPDDRDELTIACELIVRLESIAIELLETGYQAEALKIARDALELRQYYKIPRPELTLHQEAALSAICERYNVEYNPDHYKPTFDLPEGYVAGWVGGRDIQATHPTIYVGCSPEGHISS